MTALSSRNLFRLLVSEPFRNQPNLQDTCMRKGCLPTRGIKRLDVSWQELDMLCEAVFHEIEDPGEVFTAEAYQQLLNKLEDHTDERSWE